MSFSDHLGRVYLEGLRRSTRQGKAKTKLLRMLLLAIEEAPQDKELPLRIADFGCGEGEILELIHEQAKHRNIELWGFDYNRQLLDMDRIRHPNIKFVEADLLTNDLSEFKNFFNIAFSINTLHEVYSFSSNNSINSAQARHDIEEVISNIAQTLVKDGELFIYDGVITDYDGRDTLRIKVNTVEAKHKLLRFLDDYKVAETFSKELSQDVFRLSVQTFMYYMSKFRFINTTTWDLEKEEIYCFFSKEQFIKALDLASMSVLSVDLLSPRQHLWRQHVTILSKATPYPYEHILLHGKKFVV